MPFTVCFSLFLAASPAVWVIMANFPEHNQHAKKRDRESLDDMSHEDLVSKCLNNFRPAWEEFFRRFIPLIKTTIKYTLDSHLARDIDIISEIHLLIVEKLCRKERLQQCNNPSGIESWLIEIVKNQTMDWLRTRGRIKRLPETQSEASMVSLSKPVGDDSGKTIGDFVLVSNDDPSKEPGEENDTIDKIVKEIFLRLQTIKNPKYEWCLRLSLIAYKPLTNAEVDQLIDMSSLTESEVRQRLDQMTRQVMEKEKKKKEEQAKAVLYWHIIRKMETELAEAEKAGQPEKDQEIQELRQKLDKKIEKREELLDSCKKISMPASKDIAVLVGIPENKEQQVSTNRTRARNEILKNLYLSDQWLEKKYVHDSQIYRH